MYYIVALKTLFEAVLLIKSKHNGRQYTVHLNINAVINILASISSTSRAAADCKVRHFRRDFVAAGLSAGADLVRCGADLMRCGADLVCCGAVLVQIQQPGAVMATTYLQESESHNSPKPRFSTRQYYRTVTNAKTSRRSCRDSP